MPFQRNCVIPYHCFYWPPRPPNKVFIMSLPIRPLSLSHRNDQMKLRIEHDVLRNILCDKGRPQDKSDPNGWRYYNKSDLVEWGLPDNWWYRLDKKGHGKQVSFPIKMRIQLDWTPLSYVVDKHRKLIPAKRKPLELLLVQMKKRDYSIWRLKLSCNESWLFLKLEMTQVHLKWLELIWNDSSSFEVTRAHLKWLKFIFLIEITQWLEHDSDSSR